jgi:glycosyltransferase involved in cell wall biosynthesis
MATNPRVSIIIPCYNQGQFLKEALLSVQQCDQSLIETIIVNDGSTESFTNSYIASLSEKYHIISQENKGLSAARNAGIAAAKGEYILLLDADNKIRPPYITTGIEVLERSADTAVVYGDAEFFGDKQERVRVGEFNMQRLMIVNYIDACAVVRKSVFEKVGMYDVNMKWGWEDWDLWLRIAFAGYKFHYIDDIVFDYRVRSASMSKELYKNYEKPNSIEKYIHEKYPERMGHEWMVDHYIKRFRKKPFLFLCKLFLKAYFPKYYNKLLAKNKIRNGL